MFLGRVARFETILLFCIAVLCTRTSAMGIEEATGLSAHVSCCIGPVSRSGSHFFPNSYGWSLSSAGSLSSLPHLRIHDDPTPAMALPDGPGAVCLGVTGFVCISLIKNRKIWISLCLFILGHGRLVAARLSRTSVPVLDPAGSDSIDESGADCSCRRGMCRRSRRASDVRSGTWLYIPDVLSLRPEVRYGSLPRLWDDHNSKSRPPQTDVMFDGSETAPAILAGGDTVNESVACGRIGWARPPPSGTRDNTG